MNRWIPLFFLTLLLIGAGCSAALDEEAQLPSNEEMDQQQDADIDNPSIEGEGELAVDVDAEPLPDESDGAGVSGETSEPTDLEEPVADEVNRISMESGNFFFSPDVISAEVGEEVEITFETNSGVHTFVIDEIDVNEAVGVNKTISFTAPSEPGTYTFYCDVGSHRDLGMEGVLIVQ